uniref:Uncharacterized protein n=1 Tax=Aegilops tauschii TaxID=37682 RepID=R7W878_AEGTA
MDARKMTPRDPAPLSSGALSGRSPDWEHIILLTTTYAIITLTWDTPTIRTNVGPGCRHIVRKDRNCHVVLKKPTPLATRNAREMVRECHPVLASGHQLRAGRGGKNLGSGQLAPQAKPDALRDDQGGLKDAAGSDTGNTSLVNGHDLVDMSMEAAISADDVMHAGGLGAKDDIGSLLPTAMDSTDFEASLRDARDYEGEKEQPAPWAGLQGIRSSGIKPSDAPQQ